MKKIVITGGAGFIGSHLVDHFLKLYPLAQIVVIDKMGYPARAEYLAEAFTSRRVVLHKVDLERMSAVQKLVAGAGLIIHAAAETSVDRSFAGPMDFTRSNVFGTHVVTECALQEGVPLLVHISTDEVYGDCASRECSEDSRLEPTNPYSASKAAAEQIVLSYHRAYGLPVRIVRPNNVYGIRQYPEKVIPRFICNILARRPLPIHGDGSHQRSFLSVLDLCRAIESIIVRGEDGAIYNVASSDEISVLEIAEMICVQFGMKSAPWLNFVHDRPLNDSRYGIVADRLRALDWRQEHHLYDDLKNIVSWYRTHRDLYPDQLMGEPEEHEFVLNSTIDAHIGRTDSADYSAAI